MRFTHSPYWYTSVTRASVILFNRCYFNVLFFDLKHNVRDTDVDLSAVKHFSGLKYITLYSRFSSQTTDSFDLNIIFSYNN